jgi:hypothetical protein
LVDDTTAAKTLRALWEHRQQYLLGSEDPVPKRRSYTTAWSIFWNEVAWPGRSRNLRSWLTTSSS